MKYRIVPKRDWGRGPGYFINGKYVRKGWIVVDDALRIVNVMPACTWFLTIEDCCKAIRCLDMATNNGKVDSDYFWFLLRKT